MPPPPLVVRAVAEGRRVNVTIDETYQPTGSPSRSVVSPAGAESALLPSIRSVAIPNRSSSAVVRYQSSAMCSSLEGAHSRAITETAAIRAQGIASRPRGKSAAQSSSSRRARHSVHPSHTSPNARARSTQTRSRRTATACSAGGGRLEELPLIGAPGDRLHQPPGAHAPLAVELTEVRGFLHHLPPAPHRAHQPPVRVRPSALPHHRVPQVHRTPPRTVAIARKRKARKGPELALHVDFAPRRREIHVLSAAVPAEKLFRCPNWRS